MVDQRAEGAGADVVAADKSKPIQPLVVAEMDSLDLSVHGSGPTVFGNLSMRTNNVQKSMAGQRPRADRACAHGQAPACRRTSRGCGSGISSHMGCGLSESEETEAMA